MKATFKKNPHTKEHVIVKKVVKEGSRKVKNTKNRLGKLNLYFTLLNTAMMLVIITDQSKNLMKFILELIQKLGF